jgi:hypothetical protein
VGLLGLESRLGLEKERKDKEEQERVRGLAPQSTHVGAPSPWPASSPVAPAPALQGKQLEAKAARAGSADREDHSRVGADAGPGRGVDSPRLVVIERLRVGCVLGHVDLLQNAPRPFSSVALPADSPDLASSTSSSSSSSSFSTALCIIDTDALGAMAGLAEETADGLFAQRLTLALAASALHAMAHSVVTAFAQRNSRPAFSLQSGATMLLHARPAREPFLQASAQHSSRHYVACV